MSFLIISEIFLFLLIYVFILLFLLFIYLFIFFNFFLLSAVHRLHPYSTESLEVFWRISREQSERVGRAKTVAP